MNAHLLARWIVATSALVLIHSSATAQICPTEWSSRFGSLNIEGGSVRASVVWDDDGPGPHAPALYVGGFFQLAGGVEVNGIAKWDGEKWSALNEGCLSPTGQTVWALAVFDDDGPGPHLPALYAAGDFTSAGGVSANWIAKWDGTSWTPLGSGLSGGTNQYPAVHALAVFDEDGAGPNPPALFAGGDFTTAGGVTANRIARWNGTSWSAVGNGTAFGGGSTVYSLVVHDGDGAGPGAPMLYAGGSFTSLGGGSGTNIARWNGSAWSSVGSSNFNSVVTLASVDHDGSGPNPPVLYAGGFYLSPINNAIARFNGTSWSAVSGGTDAAVWGMAAIDDDGAGPLGEALYVGGEFTHAGGLPANHVARFDGTTWSALGSGVSNSGPGPIVYSFARFDADGAGAAPAYLYTGGFFDTAGGVSATEIARWDGASWSTVQHGVDAGPGNFSGTTVRALQVFDEDGAGPEPPALFVAGKFKSAGGQAANRIARYDGANWSTLSSGMDDSVFALCVFDDDDAGPNPPALFAAGDFTTAGGVGASHIAKWNGSSWVPLGAGINGTVLALAVFDDDGAGPNPPALYATGFFSQAGGNAVNNIARWDGTTWSALGAGIDSTGTALTVFDLDGPGPLPASLIVGGWYANAGGAPASGIAQWNGGSWSTMGSGVGGSTPYVYSLSVFDPDGAGPAPSQLIIGGSFTSAGGTPAPRIASWDGSSWSSLSSGMSNGGFNCEVASLLSFDVDGPGPIAPVLYAGGDFALAGGTSARNIAVWNGTSWSALDGGVTAYSIYWSAVAALAAFDDDGVGPVQSALYAGGDLENANGGVSSLHIARWGAPPCSITAFCFGDGSGAACPCTNNGMPSHGCQNSASTGGAVLTGAGTASLAADTLVLTSSSELASVLSIFLQGGADLAVPANFGDGLRCVGGSLKRLYNRNASAGVVSAPMGADLSISSRSAALGDTITAGATRSYQVYYRDPNLSFCPSPTGSSFNVSQAVRVLWAP